MSINMTDKTPSSAFRLRIACEECHARKIRCCPSMDDSSGACEACRFYGRKCLFSLKGKLGRPRKLTRTTSETPETGGLILETGRAKTATMREYPNDRPSVHSQDSSHNDSARQSLKSPTISQSSRQNLQEWDQDMLGEPKRNLFVENGEMTEIQQSRNTMQYLESYDEPLSTYANGFMDFSKDDFSQIPVAGGEVPILEDWSDPQLQVQQLSKPPTEHARDDYLEILQTYGEVHKQSSIFSRQKRSLVSATDQDDLRQIMDTMQKMSGAITSFSKNASSMDGKKLRDQSLAMVIFASVIQAVENVSQFKELDVQIDEHSFGYQSQSQRSSQPSPPESIISIDDWGAVSGMRLELIMVVTRLDFFLMQFKAFISQFNSLITIVSISHPADLIAKLQSLHQQIGIVLEKLRSEWA